jgi:hypothetical protein
MEMFCVISGFSAWTCLKCQVTQRYSARGHGSLGFERTSCYFMCSLVLLVCSTRRRIEH